MKIFDLTAGKYLQELDYSKLSKNRICMGDNYGGEQKCNQQIQYRQSHGDNDDIYNRELDEELERRANSAIERARNTTTGRLGEFIKKCKSSKKLEANGLRTNSNEREREK